MTDYTIAISAEGAGFLATVPDLPGCMSDGRSVVEAYENAQDAIKCWTEAARKAGRDIPEARFTGIALATATDAERFFSLIRGPANPSASPPLLLQQDQRGTVEAKAADRL